MREIEIGIEKEPEKKQKKTRRLQLDFSLVSFIIQYCVGEIDTLRRWANDLRTVQMYYSEQVDLEIGLKESRVVEGGRRWYPSTPSRLYLTCWYVRVLVNSVPSVGILGGSGWRMEDGVDPISKAPPLQLISSVFKRVRRLGPNFTRDPGSNLGIYST